MQSSTFLYHADDGAELFVYSWLPDEGTPCKGIVQIAHGLAEHAARYAKTAAALVAAGYGVFAHDHRGHGQTVEQAGVLGSFATSDGWERVVRDVHGLSDHIRAAHPGLPIFLFGHSMGSFLAQHLMAARGQTYAGVVLCASNGRIGALRVAGTLIAKLEGLRLGRQGRSSLLHAMSFSDFNKPFKPARTDFDWLSRDPEVVDAYIRDPKCGFIATVGLWQDFLYGLGWVEDPANQALIPKGLPVYVIAGSRDPVSRGTTGLVQLLNAYKALELRNVSHRFYPDARHELLNETNREEVLQDLVAWLDAQVATPWKH